MHATSVLVLLTIRTSPSRPARRRCQLEEHELPPRRPDHDDASSDRMDGGDFPIMSRTDAEAAVGRERGAGDRRRLVRRDERDQVRDFLGRRHPAERVRSTHALRGGGIGLRREPLLDQARARLSGQHGVDADAGRRRIQRQAPRQAEQTRSWRRRTGTCRRIVSVA